METVAPILDQHLDLHSLHYLCPLGVSLQKFANRAFYSQWNGRKFGFDLFGLLRRLLSSHIVCCVETWKHTRKMGANTRKTSANPNHVTIGICKNPVFIKRVFWGNEHFLDHWAKTCLFFFVTQIYVAMEGAGMYELLSMDRGRLAFLPQVCG